MLKLILFSIILYPLFVGQEQFPFFLIGWSKISWIIFCLLFLFIILFSVQLGVLFDGGLRLLENQIKIGIVCGERSIIELASFVLYR